MLVASIVLGGATALADISNPTQSRTAADERGGALTVVATDDVDFIDPGQTYYGYSWMIMYAVHRPLFSYEPDNAEDAVPDLAEAPPEVSEDGKTVTVRIRRGVKFAPPVDREVTSADVKYAIERGFFESVANGYAGAYFGDIVGAKTAAKAGTEIPGITTPDPHTIVITLSKPTGGVVAGALSMPISAPVPKEYAEPFDEMNPSKYGEYQVATGPYMIENDAAGKAIGYKPGRYIHLVRNPNWDQSLDFRPAYLDQIEIQEGNDDLVVAGRRILEGRSLVSGDGQPPPEILNAALTDRPSQIAFLTSGGGSSVAMNTALRPFDDLNVRRAIVAGFDREALRLARGGELVGAMPTHVIPPGIPGFEEAGGREGPGLDFLAKPAGDPALSAEYFQKAGFSSGKYEGKERVLMVGTSGGASEAVARLAKENFERLGFQVRLRLVANDEMLTRYCGVPAAKVHVCPNLRRSKDFADPQTLLDPAFNGGNILPENNPNWSQLDVAQINRAMEAAAELTDPAERAQAWADVDKAVTEQAPVIPYLWDTVPIIWSSNVNAVGNAFLGQIDLSFTSIRD